MNIEITGSGPPLVLLHGWALNLRVFDPLVAQLSSRFTLHAIDLPGHGRSAGPLQPTPEAIATQLLARLPPRFHLLGWSLGGMLSMAMAAQASERVESLTLVATTPRFTAGEDWTHGVAPSLLQRMAQQLATDPARTVQEMLELQVRGSQDAPAVLGSLRHALLAHGAARADELAAGLELLGSADLRSSLGAIRAPTLVLAGQYDRVTHPSAGRWLAQQLPQARFHEFARCGHAPFLSHGAQFTELLGEFLSDVQRAHVHRSQPALAGAAS